MPNLNIESLRGGFDDTTPFRQRAEDSCTVAESVEFFLSSIGERRKGTQLISTGLPAGITANALLGGAYWAGTHNPDQHLSRMQLFVLTLNGSRIAASLGTPRLFRLAPSGGSFIWSEISLAGADTLFVNTVTGVNIHSVTLHGKLYMAFQSSVDRLHVIDETGTMRRTGLAQTAAGPTVADGGGAGTYAAIPRFYRTRSVVMAGSLVRYRSEPSVSSAVFTPDGAHLNATVTQPATIGEGETHWEVEVSLDNTVFYRLAQVVIGTATYADSAVTTTYSANELSDPIGNYGLIPSVRVLAVDNDRLLTGGSYTTAADGSAVRWTPVGNDPLPGPDERLDTTTDPRLDLDSLNGGDITGISLGPIAFKDTHTYSLNRTNLLVGAYDAQPITLSRGAIEHTIIEATDNSGRPMVFWLDPFVGAMTYGSNGLQFAGLGIAKLWASIAGASLKNQPTTTFHGVFYPAKKQIHWWAGNMRLTLQVSEIRLGQNGYERGWSYATTGRIGLAQCSVAYLLNPDSGFVGSEDLTLVPYIGMEVWQVNGSTITDVVQRCDVTNRDGFTTGDTAASYTAKVRGTVMQLGDMITAFGIKDGWLLAKVSIGCRVRLIRDMGVESVFKDYAMALPANTFEPPSYVSQQMDNLTISECRSLQVQFEDTPGLELAWELYACSLVPGPEQNS